MPPPPSRTRSSEPRRTRGAGWWATSATTRRWRGRPPARRWRGRGVLWPDRTGHPLPAVSYRGQGDDATPSVGSQDEDSAQLERLSVAPDRGGGSRLGGLDCGTGPPPPRREAERGSKGCPLPDHQSSLRRRSTRPQGPLDAPWKTRSQSARRCASHVQDREASNAGSLLVQPKCTPGEEPRPGVTRAAAALAPPMFNAPCRTSNRTGIPTARPVKRSTADALSRSAATGLVVVAPQVSRTCW